MQPQSRLLLSNPAGRLSALAVLCTAIALLHHAGVVRLVTWTQPVLAEEHRPLLLAGVVLLAVALVGARGSHRRAILLGASLGAMAIFSVEFTLLSLAFFALHYTIVFSGVGRHYKLAFLLATYLGMAIVSDRLLWPHFLAAHPAVSVFCYVFAVNYTFRLFYFHHEMKIRNFVRVPFSSYLLYMAFAPYFIVLPYMLAIPRYRDFAPHLDEPDLAAECRGIHLLARGILFVCLWHVVVVFFDPHGIVEASFAEEDWPTLIWLGMLYAPATFFSVVGETLILIGLINVLGIPLHPPFKDPLRASSVLEWWRRWNTHFRDFLVDLFYYPLLIRWRTRNRYLTIAAGCFMVFIVGSTYFHWSAKYYFTYGNHERIMWSVMAENVFMFAFVTVGLCLEQRRVARRAPRRQMTFVQRGIGIAATWMVLALAVVFIGRGIDYAVNGPPIPSPALNLTPKE